MNRKGVLFAALIVLLAVVALPGWVGAAPQRQNEQPQAGTEIASGTILVQFRASTRAGLLGDRVAAVGAVMQEALPIGSIKVLRVAPGSEISTVQKLRSMPEVTLAEPNYIRHLLTTPNDPFYATDQWNMPLINAPAAWDRPQGPGPIVGILDSGLDAGHPDFAGRVAAGSGRVANRDGVCGQPVSSDDDHGHGTHVAGIIGAAGNNGVGVAGLSWTSTLLPFKAAAADGTLCSSDWIYGLGWLVNHGARIVNMSFGGSERSAAELAAIGDAWNRGVLLVAAAGNAGSGIYEYPASYDNVLSVGAIGADGLRSTFSNHNDRVALVAPGGGNVDFLSAQFSVYSTYPRNKGSYTGESGTSMAAPHVSGAAALLLTARPAMTNVQLRAALLSSAADKGPAGRDDAYGAGLLDVAAALDLAAPLPTATPDPNCIFSDVCAADYFYKPVQFLSAHGAISGYADNSFRPYSSTTRGQLAKILVAGKGWSIDTSGGPHFTDVAEDSPFYPYVETAYYQGVIGGYDDGTFRWASNVTRGQLAKIIVKAQGWTSDTTGGPHFADVPRDSTFYPYVETAYNHGILSGYDDGAFRWAANATRGQIAKVVWQALGSP